MYMSDYKLSTVIDAFDELQEKNGVFQILELVKEKIFDGELTSENIEEFKSFTRKFTAMYYLMKDKFEGIYRDGGERYFEHLRAVVVNVLELPNPNLQKVMIALAHDSIEDTNKTFAWLAEDYGSFLAIWVQALSKNHWSEYRPAKYKNTDAWFQETEADKAIKYAAVVKRNEDYFGHLESFGSMKQHIISIAKKYNVEITKEQAHKLTQDALDVKFADRIHNLSTQWDPNNLGQVRKKVDETKTYFLKVARETNIDAYSKLQSLVLQLEIQLNRAGEKVENILEG